MRNGSQFKGRAKSQPKNHGRNQGQTQSSLSQKSKQAHTQNPRVAPRRGAGPVSSPSEIPRQWRVIVGDHAIKQVILKNPNWIKKAWMKTGWESSLDLRELAELFKQKRISMEVKPEAALAKIYPNHQGCFVFAEGRPRLEQEQLEAHSHSTVLALDGVEDPHNLGAIIRTSWLTGVHAILSPEDRSVGLSPTVHKVACGGVEHVPFESIPQFHSYIEDLKQKGYWVFGLSHKSDKTIFDVKIPEKVVWVMGAEDKGIRSTTERICDELVSLPQIDAAASYNVSVAAAMTLMETFRQRLEK